MSSESDCEEDFQSADDMSDNDDFTQPNQASSLSVMKENTTEILSASSLIQSSHLLENKDDCATELENDVLTHGIEIKNLNVNNINNNENTRVLQSSLLTPMTHENLPVELLNDMGNTCHKVAYLEDSLDTISASLHSHNILVKDNINIKPLVVNANKGSLVPINANKMETQQNCKKTDLIKNPESINSIKKNLNQSKENILSDLTTKSKMNENICIDLVEDKFAAKQAYVCSTETSERSENVNEVESKSKPIRSSKIGLKKPREKLGERLGARKLGFKPEKISLNSYSSDNCIIHDIKCTTHSEKVGNSVFTSKAEGPCKTQDNVISEMLDSLEINKIEEDREEKQVCEEIQGKRWQQSQKWEGKHDQTFQEDTLWGSWGGWGSSLLTAASTFSREVSKGVGTVIETVEGSLGVPDPEILAREMVEKEKMIMKIEVNNESDIGSKNKATNEADANYIENEKKRKTSLENEKINLIERPMASGSFALGGLSTLGSLVSGVSGALESASNKVLLGGLDTLEMIGRKTMEKLQDGDPGLMKKRSFLFNSKPNLASVLKDARQQAAIEQHRRAINNQKSSTSSDLQSITIDQVWNTTEGPAHMEALHLIAKQCQLKMTSLLQKLPPYIVERIQKSNADIKQCCELQEDTKCQIEFETCLSEILSLMALPLQTEKIKKAWSEAKEVSSLILEEKIIDGVKIKSKFSIPMVTLVSQFIAVMHKGAEVAFITSEADPLEVSMHFQNLCCLVCSSIEQSADEVCGYITTSTFAADTKINSIITNIYLEASSANGLVQQGFMELVSVLQYGNAKSIASEI